MAAATAPAAAQQLTLDLEVMRLPSVGASWQTVSLRNNYSSAVVTCTYNLISDGNPPATVRVRNVTATSFDVRIQQFENSSVVSAAPVHCVIADAGAYNLPGGLKFEAGRVTSDRTSGLSVPDNWNAVGTEEITGSLSQSYNNPVVMGQVMTFNDARASVFWSNNCVNRNLEAGQNGRYCVGKHIGQINSTRSTETLGYFVVEQGSGSINDMQFAAALGADSVAGVGNNPPYNYSLSDNFEIGIASQAGEDGGQGGWAVLYGSDPLPSGSIRLAIDEETVAGDTSRTHTNEQVGYWVFKDNQTADVTVAKTSQIDAASISVFSIPGSEQIYTIAVSNSGTRGADANSLLVVDALPDGLTFFNGDFDGAGPATGSVRLIDGGSALTLSPASDVRFATGTTAPANFAACNYTAAAGYDPAIRFVCIRPSGEFSEGSLTASSFQLQFKARIE